MLACSIPRFWLGHSRTIAVVSAAICAINLNVQRGKSHILHDLTVEIPRGVIMGLLGPSGSGKTTLMRSIVGLQRITSGEIQILDLPAASKPLRSKIGYSTQSASVYSDLTCIQNIRYFAALYPHNEKSPEEILEDVDLSRNADQMAESLSGGERARLALATTLVGTPELLILDEPTVGLDPVLRVQLWALFNKLAAQGKTLLVSSHVMDEADTCHQLILLREGRVLAQGTPTELRARTGKSRMDEVFISLIGAA